MQTEPPVSSCMVAMMTAPTIFPAMGRLVIYFSIIVDYMMIDGS